jgi:hypothetical protein
MQLTTITCTFKLHDMIATDTTRIGLLSWIEQISVCSDTLRAMWLTVISLTSLQGNARIQGMTEDLNMTGDDYNVALFTFFIT